MLLAPQHEMLLLTPSSPANAVCDLPVRIIEPRVEEILELLRDRLAASPFHSQRRQKRLIDSRRPRSA